MQKTNTPYNPPPYNPSKRNKKKTLLKSLS